MSRIGFVLLTHANPPQMLRLVRRLNSMFDHPPIVCHHDFGKCPLPEGFLPENVEFVLPYLSTGWAKYSVVKATVIALSQMYRRADSPDWCVILSGACYPIKLAAQILANLSAGEYDAHFEVKDLNQEALSTNLHKLYFTRYCVKKIPYPSVDKSLRLKTRYIPLPHFIGSHFLPFHAGLRCYAGSQWFSVNRRAAAYIAEFQKTPDAAALAKHYETMLFSEESYFQTIVCNAPGLKVHDDNLMYLDWQEGEAHPKLLTLEDLEALKASPKHFARKFDMSHDADLMDALDQIIDQDAAVATR